MKAGRTGGTGTDGKGYDSRIVNNKQLGAVRIDREFPPDTMFMTWFNALRSSYGIYSQGRSRGDQSLIQKGRSTLDLLLSSPTQNGAFSTTAGFRQNGFQWYASQKHYGDQIPWGPTSFNTFDMGWAAYWVLRWYEDLTPDANALTFARSYGDFLLSQQLPSGALPSWIAQGSLQVDPHLRESAQTSTSVLFLAELAHVMENANDPHYTQYLSAAQKAGQFVWQQNFLQQRWDDFEVFYSNAPKSEGASDPISGQKAQNTLSMHFAAAGFLALYQTTEDHTWLDNGQRILDYLLQYQAVWPASFLSLNTYGGFSVQNTDQEWDDARQSQLGTTLLDYARASGRADYAERGIAALRSAYATMASPSAQIINPRYFDTNPAGYTPENYAHTGFDWGEGSAAAGFAEARNRFGDVWVDGNNKTAYGIDNVYVQSMNFSSNNLSLTLTSPSANQSVLLKAEGFTQNINLQVNGGQVQTVTPVQLAGGIAVPTHQSIRIVHNPTRTQPFTPGQPFQVNAIITAGSPLQSATLHYRAANSTWQQLAMQNQGNSVWSGTVPGTATGVGQPLEYYFTAATATDTGQAPEVDPSDVPFTQG